MRRLSLILCAVLLAVLLVREPDAPLRARLDGDEVPALSCADPTPDLMHSNSAPRLQGVAMDAALRDQPGWEPGEGASANETARIRGDFDAQWAEIMAGLETNGYYAVETVVFPENWLDEVAEASRDPSMRPTVSGAPAR